MPGFRLILASESPRRRELLSLLGLPFEVVPSAIDEGPSALIGPAMEQAANLKPAELAKALSWQKAHIVWSDRERIETLVLGADTIVVIERRGTSITLGKPQDAADARRMLRLLSDTTHTVLTGLTFMWSGGNGMNRTHLSDVIATQVSFRKLSDEIIEAYVATGEPFDKAGGYGIQGFASTFVEAIHGDYFNVVGLPLFLLCRLLPRFGVEIW